MMQSSGRSMLPIATPLTGESFPVEKRPGIVPASTPLSGRSNCVFQGTSVRSGTARVLVVHTGSATAYGQIAKRITRQPPEGEFARGSVLRARVRTEVDLASIPLFGSIGTVGVSGDAAAPVDRYRSLLTEPSP